MRSLILIASFSFFAVKAISQANIRVNQGGTVTVNAGDNFYDSGGAAGNYGNNENFTTTLCSSNGKSISFDFSSAGSYDITDPGDTLFFYDGATATGTPIAFLDWTDKFSFSQLKIGTKSSCVTLKFVSDGSSVSAGWAARINLLDPPVCLTNPAAADIFGQATFICNLNNYCGDLSAYYGEDRPLNLSGGGDCPSPTDGVFGGTLENNAWLAFQARSTTADFEVNVPCASGNGLQVAVLDTVGGAFVRKSQCNLSDGDNTGTFTLTATGLTVCRTYFIMIDGNAGATCSYTIKAKTGVNIVNAGPDQAVCSSNATLAADAPSACANGKWTVVSGTAVFANDTDPNTAVSGLSLGDNILRWTLTGSCVSSTDEVKITVSNCNNFSIFATAAWLTTCSSNSFFNTTGSGADLIDQVERKNFNDTFLGTYVQNSGNLIFRGGEVKTSKTALGNVCSARMYYRVFLQGATPGTFNTINLPFFENCAGNNQFPSGGPCQPGDQKWQRVIPNGSSPVDLTGFPPGNYVLQVYYDVTGDANSTTLCRDLITLNNAGNFYKATFTIQNTPTFTSTNPTTCNGTEGTISISGLAPNTTYSLSYTDDGTTIGPSNRVSDATGKIVLTGLNAGSYSNFSLVINGCTISNSNAITISNPVFNPTFTFANTLTICNGDAVPTLPTTSTNSINGTWSATSVSNTLSGTYTFTPTSGQCANAFTLTVTVNQKTTPTFSFANNLTICNGDAVPTLPTTSVNGIPGSWSTATVSNTQSGTYTFTPASGQCANNFTLSVTVNPVITPTFSFANTLTICSGDEVPALPTTSTNGITGTWSATAVSNTQSGAYTFTPTSGQCANAFTLTVTVNQKTAPTFTFANTLTICNGDEVPALPTTSTNSITGSWSAATVSNTQSGTYTFTPTSGQCANTFTLTVTVNQKTTPTFSFANTLNICNGDAVPTLPTTSVNGIPGSWSTATVSNTESGTYTFTPASGQCANSYTLNVTVTLKVKPTFNPIAGFCQGAVLPQVLLPTTSNNGITGTWNPPALSSAVAGNIVYTFTPNAGQCADTAQLTVIVTPNTTPTFSFANTLTICNGDAVPTLPTTSTNSISGTWSAATVSNTQSGTYTFTPTSGQCANSFTLTVTVNQRVTPTFAAIGPFCSGDVVPTLSAVSTNNIVGIWNPVNINNQQSGSYTFTPASSACAVPVTINIVVNTRPSVTAPSNITVYHNNVVPSIPLQATGGGSVGWTNSNTSIGLAGSGSGSIPSFTAVNTGNGPVTATINIVPANGNCQGEAQRFTITVLPLSKDVFVPNVFSPNGDGKNDELKVYGNYISKLELRIFNQWGEQIVFINNQTQGWNGTHRGKPQPVGVYAYVLRATLTDGTVVNKKGSITLLR